MDGQSTIGYTHHRHKRTHDEMRERRPFRTPSFPIPSPQASSHAHSNHSGSAGPSAMTPEPQEHTRPRFAGDGLDFRRPAFGTAFNPRPSNNDEMVIDLTAEEDQDERPAQEQTRAAVRANNPPHFPGSAEIIDLSADTPLRNNENTAGNARRTPDSPEIQFIRSRPRFNFPPNRLAQQAGHQLLERIGLERIEDEDDDEDEEVDDDGYVELLEVRPRQQPPPRLINRVDAILGAVGGHLRQILPGGLPGPGLLDYDAVGFHIGGPPRARTPPPPVYNAPDPAPAGFTRSPEEDEVLVCPNCGEELCTGESEIKRQVWIVRRCGHIYCGECTTHRQKSKRKGKGAAINVPAFATCVVEGCSTQTSPTKSMVQLFL